MSSLELQHLRRTLFSLGGSAGVSIVNPGRKPAAVQVNVKRGATWAPWSGCVTLAPGGRWWAPPEQVSAEQVCVVVASGRDDHHGTRQVEC